MMRSEGRAARVRRSLISSAAVVLLVMSPSIAPAQQTSQVDSAGAHIQRTLRAFYFNLARGDWEAMTADILAAKVVAHRSAPDALVLARARGSSSPAEPRACSTGETAVIDQATIRVDGEWAEASVPRCGVGFAQADEFRLIHFEERWRFVYIDLSEEPASISTGR
jgi:hypothetical protein